MTGRGYRGGDIILFLDLGNGLHEYSLCDDSSHHVMIFCASFYVYYYSNKLLIKRLQKPNKKILLPID